MRICLLVIILLISLSTVCRSQHWQTVVSLDTRVGYSTNQYLNPFLSEWDTSVESSYNFTSLLGQTFWHRKDHSLSLTGGVLYEPLFGTQFSHWKGGIGLIDYNYRLSNSISLGLEGGVSHLSSNYNRTLFWAQPKVTWFVSSFTLFRLKLGPNFRIYRNYQGVAQSNDQFNVYNLEIETWPNYQWQFTAGLSGTLNNLPDIAQGFNSRASIAYHFRNGASVSLSGGMQQYQFTSNTGGGGPGNFPPVGGGQNTVSTTDRIFRLGLNGNLPLNEKITLFAGVETLKYDAESANAPVNDYQVSGGVRFSFEPTFKTGQRAITPEWNKNRGQQQVRIEYSGDGRLYLVGSFNNWDKTGIPLTKQADNIYVTQLSLTVGAHEYKVLEVQGDSEKWLRFSDDIYTVDDGFGSENAMLLIE